MKKRKLIDLPKPTLELLARCAAALKPPPAMTLSEWADRYRVLSAESSAEPGRWHTDKAPYQREIMDAIGDPHIRKVVIMSAAQLGKTDAGKALGRDDVLAGAQDVLAGVGVAGGHGAGSVRANRPVV